MTTSLNSPENNANVENELTFFKEYCKVANIDISLTQLEQFFLYKTALLDWNTRMNLTGIKDDRGIEIKHFADSISITSLIPTQIKIVIDIGTGAGFPGIPLAIMNPEVEVYLVESIGKKVSFLEHIEKTLNLRNTKIIHGRAEEFIMESLNSDKNSLPWSKTLLVARAVSSFDTLFNTIQSVYESRETNIMFQKSTLAATAELAAFFEKQKADNNFTRLSYKFEILPINDFGFEELKGRSVIVGRS